MKFNIIGPSLTIVTEITHLSLIVSGLRALLEKHERDKTLTPKLKDQILNIQTVFDQVYLLMEQMEPELSQSLYDEFSDLEKLNILQPSCNEL